MVKKRVKHIKSVLIITEVFYPEEFLINDVVKKWGEIPEYEVKILTRNPSYPYGKVYPDFKNKIYQRASCLGADVHRYHVFEGYKNSTAIKILNYLWNSLLATLIAILKFRKEKNIFVYHTGPLTVAFPGVILKKINGGKLTIWTQDIWPDTIFAYGIKRRRFVERLIKRYVKWVYKNCDKILVSSASFEKVINEYTDTEIEFVPNWANQVFSSGLKETEDTGGVKFSFSFAGNVGKVQNLETVIHCFNIWQVQSNIKNATLNIYGDGSNLEALKAMVAENEIENVKFWGRLPISKMPEVYNKSNVLIISLEDDSVFNLYLPAKFSTYLSAGKPIFGIAGGDVKMLIDKYNLGYAANPKDSDLIVAGFDYLYNMSPNEVREIKKRAGELFENLFDEEKNIKEIESALWNDR